MDRITRKGVPSPDSVAAGRRKPIGDYAGKDPSTLPGQDVLVCPERNAICDDKEKQGPAGLCQLIGPTKIAVIAAVANGCDYAMSISRVYGFTPGTVSSAIAALKDSGIIEGNGYYRHVGKRGPPKHVYELTDLGKTLAVFLEMNDEYYRSCVDVSKPRK